MKEFGELRQRQYINFEDIDKMTGDLSAIIEKLEDLDGCRDEYQRDIEQNALEQEAEFGTKPSNHDEVIERIECFEDDLGSATNAAKEALSILEDRLGNYFGYRSQLGTRN